MDIKNRGKARRYANLVAKKTDQSARLNRGGKAAEMLKKAIEDNAGAIYYQAFMAKSDRAFRPVYMVNEPVWNLIIKDGRAKHKIVAYRTVPLKNKGGREVPRPISCFKDGTRRFELAVKEALNEFEQGSADSSSGEGEPGGDGLRGDVAAE